MYRSWYNVSVAKDTPLLGSTGLRSDGLPLGFCRYCFRMRWIQEMDTVIKERGGWPEKADPVPTGKCTQCVRDGVDKPL